MRHHSESYRSLHAAQDLKKGDLVLWIPLNVLISPENEENSEFTKKLGENFSIEDEKIDKNSCVTPSTGYLPSIRDAES